MTVRGRVSARTVALGLATLAFVGTPSCAGAAADLIGLVPVASGLTVPVAIAHAGDGSGRLFVAEQTGRIRVVAGGALLPTPFLDLSGLVSCCQERGLLGLAFHPDYAANGLLYVHYTDSAGTIVIARYQRAAGDPDRADPASARVLLAIPHAEFANHNGGQLAFGPDGYLYAGVGDGGGGGDPFNRAPDLGSLLGKLLRLDVDGPSLAPPTNPFAGVPGARGEIWALGLRNPWRFSFDRVTGDLFIADVGQNAWEEVDVQPAGSPGGENYCWSAREGRHVFDAGRACTGGTPTEPILEYDHSLGCSITGGFRYRGAAYPGLATVYVYGDFCSGRIWGARQGTGGAWTTTELADTGLTISTFGEGPDGTLYVADHGGGVVYGIVGTLFGDVGPTHWARSHVEALYRDGITAGCGSPPLLYCPDLPVSREQMAVFLLRAARVPDPSPCLMPPFADVPCESPFAPWIAALDARGITAGCGGGLYCPGRPVSRAEMAVFLLRALEPPGYVPPACTAPPFTDVPCDDPYAAWIADLAGRGVTSGCGGGNYCPGAPVSRAEMAGFLVTAFGRPL